MQAVSLHLEQPRYSALSYCWTDAEPTCEIQVNDTIVRIRPNLYAFLQLAHSERREDWMFIDALCINQSNPSERNHQVALMASVYSNAEMVIVWLGETTFQDDETGEQLRFVCETISGETASSLNLREFVSMHHFSVTTCMKTFLDKRYWSRVWIVQEVMLATALEFRASSLSLSSPGLERLCLCHREISNGFPLKVGKVDSNDVGDVHSILRSRATGLYGDRKLPVLTLAEAVGMTARRKCAVSHDHVYGLLAFTRKQIQVDYQMPVLDLLLRAFIAGMLERGYVQRTAGDNGLESLSYAHDPANPDWQFNSLVITLRQLPAALSIDMPDPLAFCALRLAMELCAKHSIWAGRVNTEQAAETLDYWMQQHCVHEYLEQNLFSPETGPDAIRTVEAAMMTYEEMKRLARTGSRYSPLIKDFDWLNERVHRIFNEMAEQRDEY